MKILFVFFSEEMSYPVQILSPIAYEIGWDVEYYFISNNDSNEDIVENIEDNKPDLVALSFRSFERSMAFQVGKLCKDLGINVLAGGLHPTYCPDDLISSGYFDGIVRGDGMGVFADILSSYHNLSGQVIYGKPHPEKNRYLKRHFSEIQKEKIRRSKSAEILTNIGCPFNCRFCSTNRNFIELPIEAVADEVIQLKSKLDFERITIQDDLFTFNAQRIRIFRKILEKEGVLFDYSPVQARVDCFSDEIAEELVALGVVDVAFGVETTSPKLLKFLNKKTTAKDAYRSAEICRKHGLAFKANFMFGLPKQDREDYELTYQFVKDVRPDAAAMFFFFPYPGSYLYSYCVENSFMPDDFSFDKYLNPTASGFDGFMDRRGILKNIDYEMAFNYRAYA